MKPAPDKHTRPAGPRLQRVVIWLTLAGALTVCLLWAGWANHALGAWQGVLLDYVDRRLEGHPRLEALARGPIGGRQLLPFQVPPPPPRRGSGEIPPPEPVPTGAKVWRVGPNGPLLTIADAARLAQSGDVVEIEAGDYRGDVAVWEQTRLTIRGVNGSARLFADGQSAEGKAIWVIRRGVFDVANLDFVGAKVEDGNGAGIRFEGGELRLQNCLFWGNQMGLLTGGGRGGVAADARLTIVDSEFAYSHVKGRWGHNVYVGAIAELTMTGSYSHHAGRGHLLKSRARVNRVFYNRFTDESGGRASYELNFPNGGEVRVVGNVLQQQTETENSVMIAYGEEGYTWPVNTLFVASNTLVNDLRHGGTFIAAVPGADAVASANNLLVGPGAFRAGPAFNQWNDVRAEWGDLARPAHLDYRLRQPSPRFAYRDLTGTARRSELIPSGHYVHPRSVQPSASPPVWVGASPSAPSAPP